MLHSVETDETAYQHLFGLTAWEYRAQHPDAATLFDNFMTKLTARIAPSVASAYDFSATITLVDVGGGHAVLFPPTYTL